MQRLTKEIAESIRKRHNVSKIFYMGMLENVEYFKGKYLMGGKVGFPCIFGISANGQVHMVRDYDMLDNIRKLNIELEEVHV